MNKNQKFIVRCNGAGVFFGEIVKREGDVMTLANVRQLWYWDGAASLMQLAKEGVSKHAIASLLLHLTVLRCSMLLKCYHALIRLLNPLTMLQHGELRR